MRFLQVFVSLVSMTPVKDSSSLFVIDPGDAYAIVNLALRVIVIRT